MTMDELFGIKSTQRLHTWILTANSAGILALLGLAGAGAA